MKTLFFIFGSPLFAISFCINAGGGNVLGSDGISIQCFADEMFSGGAAYTDTDVTAAPGADVTTRFGNFTYTIPAIAGPATSPPGFYRVTLNFIDPNVTAPGGRIFYVLINGQPTPNIDLAAETNGVKKLVTKTYFVISYGQVKIQFVTVVRNAIVNSIVIDPIAPLDLFAGVGPDTIQAAVSQMYRDALVNHPCITGHPGAPPYDHPCPLGYPGILVDEWRRLAQGPGPICLRMDVTGSPTILESSAGDCLTDPLTWWYRKDGAGNVLN